MTENSSIAEVLKELCLFYRIAQKGIEKAMSSRHKAGLQYERNRLLYEICSQYRKEIDELFKKMFDSCSEEEKHQLRRYYLRGENYTCSKSRFYRIVRKAVKGVEDEIRKKADQCLVHLPDKDQKKCFGDR